VIMLGWQVRYRPVSRGTFHCGRCGGDRRYRQLAGRRWFYLLFVPLIPLSQTGQHVRCTICGTCYRIEVLGVPTTAQMEAALPAGMRAAAVAILSADGGGGVRARRHAADAIRKAGLTEYSAPALDADLSADSGSPRHDQELAGALGTLAIQLAGPARGWFLADVVRIGLADGPLTDAQRDTANEIGARLGMTPAQARGVISMTEEAAA
jgi:hypothetical protein